MWHSSGLCIYHLFRLYHQIIYICYFVASYLFSLWFDWFLWHCFVLLLGEILFLLPFLSHVQIFSCEMLFISRLERSESCFSSHFCFLVIIILLSIVLSVSFLMVVISPPSCFSMLSSSRCIDASILCSVLASPLPPSFLDTYSLSTSSHHSFFSSLARSKFLTLFSFSLIFFSMVRRDDKVY